MRKIIQVSAMGCEATSQTQTNAIIVALCDDGSVWVSDCPFKQWNRLPFVPQDTFIKPHAPAPPMLRRNQLGKDEEAEGDDWYQQDVKERAERRRKVVDAMPDEDVDGLRGG